MAQSNQASLHDFVQRVKDATMIEQVVSGYVPDLARRGSSWKACCPFHGEKTPSFHVHPDKGFYHCFGCGVHGDAIKFVQEIEKVDFMMALETLARRAGLEMPRFKQGEGGGRDDQRLAAMRSACTWAAKFFAEQLDAHPRGKVARQYLRGRDFNDDLIREYGLGYSPPAWEALQDAAREHGFSAEILAEAGLVTRRDEGGFSDRFRDRVMFPIADAYGQVVAFGGRVLDPDSHPAKYINSAETAIFKKGRLLYGQDRAREAIKDTGTVVLLEGYMDWLALHAAGVKNVLAGMGTALTEDQARVIKRQARAVTLLYDGDEAGAKAMFRSAEILLGMGLEVAAGILPEGLDPDDFIRKHGTQALRDILAAAPPVIDHFTHVLTKVTNTGRPLAKAEAVGTIVKLLLAVQNPIELETYIRNVAVKFRLKPETIEEAVFRRRKSGPIRIEEQKAQAYEVLSKTEEALLYIILNHWKHQKLLQQVQPEFFSHPLAIKILNRLLDTIKDIREGANEPEDIFMLCQNDADKDFLVRLLFLPQLKFSGDFDDGASRVFAQDIESFGPSTMDIFALQMLKLKKLLLTNKRFELIQDMRLIDHDDPNANAPLAESEAIARQQIADIGDYLNNRG